MGSISMTPFTHSINGATSTYAIADLAGVTLRQGKYNLYWAGGTLTADFETDATRDLFNIVQQRAGGLWLNTETNFYQHGGQNVVDDGQLVMDASTNGGFGIVQAGDGEEYGFFSFTSTAVVTLISNSANTVNTDTDTKFCIYDGGSVVKIRNRLGSTKKVLLTVWYN
jgi:hypothetical protein